ncbi:MAG: DMT family transporter [Alterinioella nitratireducens]|uniref:DMT family transporter n=1 Tax=Alterinioella nitratireducens TaxID=2735915 RepID=UPI0040582C29
MPRKDSMDAFGAASLIGIAVILAVNQVVIKLGNLGVGPVFMAGLRSLLALIVLLVWMRIRGIRFAIVARSVPAGLLLGALFTVEFIFLFLALDLTTVARTSILFYSMPVWLTLAAHFLLPGERMGRLKLIGLALAFAGVVLALLDRDGGGQASLLGDLLGLGAALAWGAIALAARTLPIQHEAPEMQLFWQLSVSAVLLTLLAPLFGPLLREPTLIHLGLLLYQSVFVASFGFLFWFHLLMTYPASSVASFSFLTPILGVLLGWGLLGEDVGWEILAAMVLVAVGITLINRPAKGRPR